MVGTVVVVDIQDEGLVGAAILQIDTRRRVDLLLSEDRMVFRGWSVSLKQVTTCSATSCKVRAMRVYGLTGFKCVW